MTTTGSHKIQRIRLRLHDILEAGSKDDKASRLVDTFLIVLIVTNVIAFALETVASIERDYGGILSAFDAVSVVIFSVEYVLRLWACVELPMLRPLANWRARLKFARRPLLIIDLLAILPFYLSFLVTIDLRVLRVFRLLRFFKIARYSPALQILGRVIANERRALFGALIVMISLLLLSSTIIYFLEREAQPEAFGSIPHAAWWALSTLTTVGYGDVVPITALGRMFGGIVMIFGVGMFALPIGIIATGFGQEVNRREFVVTWSMIAKVPLFAHLNAASITHLMTRLQAQSFPTGSQILDKSDEVNAIYFIASGEVSVVHNDHKHLLRPGDFFGDSTLDETESEEAIIATAVSNCSLLVLEREDFDKLLQDDETLRTQIALAVQERQQQEQAARAGKRGTPPPRRRPPEGD